MKLNVSRSISLFPKMKAPTRSSCSPKFPKSCRLPKFSQSPSASCWKSKLPSRRKKGMPAGRRRNSPVPGNVRASRCRHKFPPALLAGDEPQLEAHHTTRTLCRCRRSGRPNRCERCRHRACPDDPWSDRGYALAWCCKTRCPCRPESLGKFGLWSQCRHRSSDSPD